jgi:hypothetical protein
MNELSFLLVQITTSAPLSGSDRFSFLQRRLGVIVGAGVGVIVFFVLMILLTCVKCKKRRLLQRSQSNGNGKIDPNNPTLEDAVTTTHAVGSLAGYHHHPHHLHQHHHSISQGEYMSTLTRNKNGGGGITTASNGNGTFLRGGMSPEFPTYRHYSITTDTPTEMDRL